MDLGVDPGQPAVERRALGDERWLTQVWNGTAADGYPVRLAETLPRGFARYVRVFHPFLPEGTEDGPNPAAAPRTTWQQVARSAGVPFSRALRLEGLEPALPDDERALEVWEGELHPAPRTALFSHLAARSSERVFFYFGLATLLHPALLYRAPCSAVEEVKRIAAADSDSPWLKGPEHVWPADRSWFVYSDFDCVSTYLGCDDGLAARVLGDPAIEALEADLDDRLE